MKTGYEDLDKALETVYGESAFEDDVLYEECLTAYVHYIAHGGVFTQDFALGLVRGWQAAKEGAFIEAT